MLYINTFDDSVFVWTNGKYPMYLLIFSWELRAVLFDSIHIHVNDDDDDYCCYYFYCSELRFIELSKQSVYLLIHTSF